MRLIIITLVSVVTVQDISSQPSRLRGCEKFHLPYLKPVFPRGQDEWLHEVEVVIVAGHIYSGGGGGVRVAADEAGFEEAAAHHHGVQDHDLVPRHIDVQAENWRTF